MTESNGENGPEELQSRPSRLHKPRDRADSGWSGLSVEDKAEKFAKSGNFSNITRMIMNGELDSLEEVEQRKLLADAFRSAAKAIEDAGKEGKYPPQADQDQNLAESFSLAPSDFRERAIRVLLNEEGKDLVDQIREMFPKVYGEESDNG